jgi:hypothetical protein
MGYTADEGRRGWQPDMDTGAYPVIDEYAGHQRLAGDQGGPNWPADPQAPLASREWQAPRAARGRHASPLHWIADVIRRAGR